MSEVIERIDSAAQGSFNSMVDYLDVSEVVSMLLELGANLDKLRGAVYGWALEEAGLS